MLDSTPMSDLTEVHQTLEGWYVLHDRYRVNWRRWNALSEGQREAAAAEVARAVATVASQGAGRGDSAVYAVIGQKADLLFLHFRQSLDELKAVELALRGLTIADCLEPAGSYLSVIEVSLYEASAIASKRLADQGVTAGSPEFAKRYEAEMAVQRQRLEARLKPVIPSARHCCFYPMNKRRDHPWNWYDLSLDERRTLMRGHGRIGHRYHHEVTQVVSGSIGFDDYEWAVTLFADDPLTFKKLITEMRFDPASSRYAEFGPFLVGIRLDPPGIRSFLAGHLPEP